MGNVILALQNAVADVISIFTDIYEYNLHGVLKPLFYTRLTSIFITTRNNGIAKWEPYSDMIGSVHVTSFEDLAKQILFIYPFDRRTNLITQGLMYKAVHGVNMDETSGAEKAPDSETKFWIYSKDPETEEITGMKIPSPMDVDEVIRVFDDFEEY